MQAHQHKLHNSLILFHLAVTNCVTEEAVRAVVPDKLYPNNSDAYGTIHLWMFSIGRQSQYQACAWLLEAVNLIIKSVESYTGPSWFYTLVSEERCEIWAAVWDQHSLFTLTKFRKRESGAVYFPQLYARFNCPQRSKFRSFFRTMFIEMAEMTYVFRVLPLISRLTRDNKYGKSIVFRLWKSYPQQEKITKACGLLEPYDLPGVPGGVSQQGNRKLPETACSYVPHIVPCDPFEAEDWE